MVHVFVVNSSTFKYHLEYMFAGTGAGDLTCDFLNSKEIGDNWYNEKKLVSMIADVSRIRKGDKILFYLTSYNGKEGQFFGVFEAVDRAFLENDNFPSELSKKIIFRIKIKPYQVYKYGVSERDCLDSLKGIEKPYEMCWSLIYRKLRANRGCTMITDYEYSRILEKLKYNNELLEGTCFTFNYENATIESNFETYDYFGNVESLNIENRFIIKKLNKKACEAHLQTYMLQNIEDLVQYFPIPSAKISWIGNEVSCGVGMQSIDLMIIQKTNEEIIINICELKDTSILNETNLKNQIRKYIDWTEDYIVPTYDKKVVINPIIVAEGIHNDNIDTFEFFKDNDFEYAFCINTDNYLVNNTTYLEFKMDNNKIIFGRCN